MATQPVPVMLDPIAAYDRIAPVFARVAEKRRRYLDSIDRLVISAIPPGSRSMLDVGSGDGRASPPDRTGEETLRNSF